MYNKHIQLDYLARFHIIVSPIFRDHSRLFFGAANFILSTVFLFFDHFPIRLIDNGFVDFVKPSISRIRHEHIHAMGRMDTCGWRLLHTRARESVETVNTARGITRSGRCHQRRVHTASSDNIIVIFIFFLPRRAGAPMYNLRIERNPPAAPVRYVFVNSRFNSNVARAKVTFFSSFLFLIFFFPFFFTIVPCAVRPTSGKTDLLRTR